MAADDLPAGVPALWLTTATVVTLYYDPRIESELLGSIVAKLAAAPPIPTQGTEPAASLAG